MPPLIQRLISSQHQARKLWIGALTTLWVALVASRLIPVMTTWIGPVDPMCHTDFDPTCDSFVRAKALQGVEILGAAMLVGIAIGALCWRAVRRRQARIERLVTIDTDTIGMIYPVENRVMATGIQVRNIRSIAILHGGGEERLRVGSDRELAEALAQLRSVAPNAQFGYDPSTDLR